MEIQGSGVPGILPVHPLAWLIKSWALPEIFLTRVGFGGLDILAISLQAKISYYFVLSYDKSTIVQCTLYLVHNTTTASFIAPAKKELTYK